MRGPLLPPDLRLWDDPLDFHFAALFLESRWKIQRLRSALRREQHAAIIGGGCDELTSRALRGKEHEKPCAHQGTAGAGCVGTGKARFTLAIFVTARPWTPCTRKPRRERRGLGLPGQIRNSALNLDEPISFNFFRTKSGVEVDFIVQLKGKTWVIEAKSGDVSYGDFSGLRSFRKHYRKNHFSVIVAPSTQCYEREGILVRDLPPLLKEMGLE